MDQNSPDRAADTSAATAGTAPATAVGALTAAPAPTHRWWRVPGGSLIAIGATCGVAWTAGFRTYMVELVGTDSAFTWDGTVGATAALPLGWGRRGGGDCVGPAGRGRALTKVGGVFQAGERPGHRAPGAAPGL
jgi:hypothetical protein